MKRLIIFLLAIILTIASFSQNNTCQTATPYIDNTFIIYNPPTNWVELYRVFQSPETSVDFTYTAFSSVTNGVAICPNIDIQYFLYAIMGNSCILIDANATGAFNNLIPGNTYVLGYIANCISAGIGFIRTGEDIALPIELLYFTAQSTPDGIDLLWASGSEFNCAGFSLERSTDASNWLNIGFVEGAGNSEIVTRYVFEDERPTPGVNYYRLTQYDLDGDFEILQTIAIVWNKETQTSPFRYYNFLGQKVN